ncbi:MAG: DNA polymerase III subunit epsilon [Xanthomonadales bacterium]|jgi:DNA polymerase-3 subunit epsilon|nr:DNA polymerase III subunit epsilon [Xanthomonadales bacterium]
MIRQVALDTETTGLQLAQGDRVIEIGAVEIIDRVRTGRHFHRYLSPGTRKVNPEALAVHGLSDDFLADQPEFSEIAAEFLGFVADAELLIHNAGFDQPFLDRELELAGRSERLGSVARVTDTILVARQLGYTRVSLNALCLRHDIDTSHREFHGALLDAELLADVYLAMTAGQVSLGLTGPQRTVTRRVPSLQGVQIPRVAVSAAELLAHQGVLDAVAKASKGKLLWPMGSPAD